MRFVSKRWQSFGLSVFLSLLAVAGGESLFLRAEAAPVSLEADSKVDEKNDVFRVVDATLNAETDKPEICVNLNHPIAITDRNAILKTITLYQDEARVDLPPEALSLTPTDICIQQLLARHKYKLIVKGLTSLDDLDLDKTMRLSFVVPDRKPTLSFLAASVGDGQRLMRLNASDDLTLRAVNVAQTHLSLYQIKDPKKWALAWQQISQNNLAPSESLTFAIQNGEKRWEGDLSFSGKPNMAQTLKVPLPAMTQLPAGLYFLSAEPHEAEASDQKTSPLAAGRWLLVGTARFEAVRVDAAIGSGKTDRIVIFARDTQKNQPLVGASIRLFGRNNGVFSEGKTDATGMAMLELDHGRSSDDVLVALDAGAAGVDLGDSARLPVLGNQRPAGGGHILPLFDKAQPGMTLQAALWFDNAQGVLQGVEASSLKLLRPDDGFYSETRVTPKMSDVQIKSFKVPTGASSGTWSLMWQKEDGQVLARVPFGVGAATLGAKLEMHADRPSLDRDGVVTLSLKLRDESGKPLAFQHGQIAFKQAALTLPGWDGYDFGFTDKKQNAESAVASFLTDAGGTARVKVNLPLGEDAPSADGSAIKLIAQIDGMPSAVDQLVLPLRMPGGWIGVKPLAENALFPENGLARFSFVAVDSSARRKAMGDLYYQIYEEGRSFTWFPSDGRWMYKPLPFHRRIGGGRLSISATADATLSWPVTAGHYVLEITTASGLVLARHVFEAGAVPVEEPTHDDPRLNLKRVNADGHEALVTLGAPAELFMVASNGSIGPLAPRRLPAGSTVVDLSGHLGRADNEKDKKGAVRLWAMAVFDDGSRAMATLQTQPESSEPKLSIDLQSSGFSANDPKTPEQHATLTAQLSHNAVKQAGATQAILLVQPRQEDGGLLPPIQMGPQKVGADGRANFHVSLPAFSASASLSLVAWNEKQVAEKSLVLPVKDALKIKANLPRLLRVGDKVDFTALLVRSQTGGEGLYRYNFVTPSFIATQTKNLTGKLKMKSGTSRSFALPFEAREVGEGVIRLELSGPGGLQRNLSLPLAVIDENGGALSGQTASMNGGGHLSLPLKVARATEKKKDAAQDRLEMSQPRGFLLAPFELPSFLPEALVLFLHSHPASTVEIAQWVQTAPLWKTQIAALGLMPENAFDQLIEQRRQILIARQRDDGGFVAWPTDKEGDVLSTAAALPVVAQADPGVAVVGARWLHHKMENAWFDDSERASRSEASLALTRLSSAVRDEARAGDPAPLRYLADTSHDKTLSSATAASLAGALAQIGDQDRARFWIARSLAQLSIPVENPDGRQIWASFARLAANPFSNLADLLPAMAHASAPASADTPAEATAFLSAYGAVAARLGTWHIEVAGEDKKVFGIWTMPVLEKNAVVSLHNPANETRYILQVMSAKIPAKNEKDNKARAKVDTNGTVQRFIYGLDGGRVGEDKPLVQGETYLVVVRGSLRLDRDLKAQDKEKNASAGPYAFRLIVPAVSAYVPVRAAMNEADSFLALWPWMPLPSGPTLRAALDTRSQSFVTALKGETFQIAYLVRAAEKGSFLLPPIEGLDKQGVLFSLNQSPLRLSVTAP